MFIVGVCVETGQTLEQAVVDIGKREFSVGMTYVAFSRVKSIHGLLIQPATKDRYTNIGKLKGLKQRLAEEKRLERLCQQTMSRN